MTNLIQDTDSVISGKPFLLYQSQIKFLKLDYILRLKQINIATYMTFFSGTQS